MVLVLIFFVSYLVLNVTLLTAALVPAFMPNYLGLLIAVAGPPLIATGVIYFFFWVAEETADRAELKTAYLAWGVALSSKRLWSWGIIGGVNMVWFFVMNFWLRSLSHGFM